MATLKQAQIQNFPTIDSDLNQIPDQVIGNKLDAAQTTVGTTISLMGYVKGLLSKFNITASDSDLNVTINDVIGNKVDAIQPSITDSGSLVGYTKATLSQVNKLDWEPIYAAGSANSIGGRIITIGTNLTTASAKLDVPTVNVATGTLTKEVIGNKSDSAVTTVGTSASIMAYVKGLLSKFNVATTNNTDTLTINGVIGNKGDNTVTTVSNSITIVSYIKGLVTNLITTNTKVDNVKTVVDDIKLEQTTISSYISKKDTWYGEETSLLTPASLIPIVLNEEVSNTGPFLLVYHGSEIGEDNFTINKLAVKSDSATPTTYLIEFFKLTKVGGVKLGVVTAYGQYEGFITYNSHGLTTSNLIYIVENVSSNMTKNGVYVISSTTENTFILKNSDGSILDSLGAGNVLYQAVTREKIFDTIFTNATTINQLQTISVNSLPISNDQLVYASITTAAGDQTLTYFVCINTI